MHKLEITLKTFSHKNFSQVDLLINKLTNFQIFQNSKMNVVQLPSSKKKIFTVLKSPHVHKKSREQFKYSTFKRKIIIKNSNVLTLLYLNMFIKKYLSKDFDSKSKIYSRRSECL